MVVLKRLSLKWCVLLNEVVKSEGKRLKKRSMMIIYLLGESVSMPLSVNSSDCKSLVMELGATSSKSSIACINSAAVNEVVPETGR